MDGSTLVDAPDEAVRLERLISHISRRCLYGEWIHHVEYSLWKRMRDGPGDFGDDAVTTAEVDELRALSKALDGWLVWKDSADQDPIKAYLASGPYPVAMSEWLALFKAWEEAPK